MKIIRPQEVLFYGYSKNCLYLDSVGIKMRFNMYMWSLCSLPLQKPISKLNRVISFVKTGSLMVTTNYSQLPVKGIFLEKPKECPPTPKLLTFSWKYDAWHNSP